jgi:Lar family restriction alleviation protein
MPELKPCPFCGGEARLVARSFNMRDAECKVACTRCQVFMVARESNAADSVEVATRTWNERYNEPQEIDFDYDAEG